MFLLVADAPVYVMWSICRNIVLELKKERSIEGMREVFHKKRKGCAMHDPFVLNTYAVIIF